MWYIVYEYYVTCIYDIQYVHYHQLHGLSASFYPEKQNVSVNGNYLSVVLYVDALTYVYRNCACFFRIQRGNYLH